MRFLLDTSVLIVLARRELHKLDARIVTAVLAPENLSFASAASLWEIAIKTRLGKLDPELALDDLPDYFEAIGLNSLVINHRHAVKSLVPEPAIRDPLTGSCLLSVEWKTCAWSQSTARYRFTHSRGSPAELGITQSRAEDFQPRHAYRRSSARASRIR